MKVSFWNIRIRTSVLGCALVLGCANSFCANDSTLIVVKKVDYQSTNAELEPRAEIESRQPNMAWAANESLINMFLNSEIDIGRRIQAVHSIGAELSSDQVRKFYRFLCSHPDPTEKNVKGLRVLKNDAVLALKRQAIPPAELTEVLIDIYRDKDQDYVTRDYAIQHLATWFNSVPTNRAEARNAIRSLLTEASDEDSTIAATALLGLHRLSAFDRNLDKHRIDHAALRLLESGVVPNAAKVTAAQICAERRLLEAVPVIKKLAGTADSIALRISAISCLGALSGRSQEAVLRELELNVNYSLRPAIRAALSRTKQNGLKQSSF